MNTEAENKKLQRNTGISSRHAAQPSSGEPQYDLHICRHQFNKYLSTFGIKNEKAGLAFDELLKKHCLRQTIVDAHVYKALRILEEIANVNIIILSCFDGLITQLLEWGFRLMTCPLTA